MRPSETTEAEKQAFLAALTTALAAAVKALRPEVKVETFTDRPTLSWYSVTHGEANASWNLRVSLTQTYSFKPLRLKLDDLTGRARYDTYKTTRPVLYDVTADDVKGLHVAAFVKKALPHLSARMDLLQREAETKDMGMKHRDKVAIVRERCVAALTGIAKTKEKNWMGDEVEVPFDGHHENVLHEEKGRFIVRYKRVEETTWDVELDLLNRRTPTAALADQKLLITLPVTENGWKQQLWDVVDYARHLVNAQSVLGDDVKVVTRKF